ncbi:extracellular matrix-binding protein EbhA-like isoform X3 [Mytilus californianus]|nr:extracellular matrix-binding protein EbhA-like isoform X3 [Mytilus californianus]XP_052065412.1 extracellular matrix-binding protein EbhA-like isoform X3 [Mytilus californianus]
MKPVKTLDDVSELLTSEVVKNVVVVAGAGISTPSGIPDFRTPGTGLYDNLQQYRIPYPEAIFDIDYFHHNPKPFFTLAKELYPSGKYRPNYIHYFLRMLYDKGKLLRMYTQNIDGLERLAGLPPEKLVEAHGTFSWATCTICGSRKEGSEVKESIFKDRLPKCGKRGCPGIVKPDIVFFGEDLPQRFYLYLRDMIQTDLVIVMGTSLEVQPFAGIIDTVKYGVPRVLFNWNAVGPFKNGKRSQDVVASGDLIGSVQKFAGITGWKSEIEQLIIQNEGSLLICSPEYAKRAANRPKQKATTEPITNAFWQRRMESSSDESSDSETDSSSESSSDDDKRYKSESFRRRGVRSTGSMKNNMGTATIKNGPNRLLNDIKKNGTNNNGQKRDLSTRVPNTRSPAPARLDKYLSGRNSAMATRPPNGKFGNGKISQAKPLSTGEKMKVSPEKLAPLSNKTTKNTDKNVPVGRPKLLEKISSLDREKVSPSKNINDTSDSVVKEKSIETAINLTDNVVPSLDRTVSEQESKTTDVINDSTANEITLYGDSDVKSTQAQNDVDSVKDGIKQLTLSDYSNINLNSSVVQNAVKDVVNSCSENKKPLPSDILLTTRSEPAGFTSTKKLDSIVSDDSKNKADKIKTIKSESALGTGFRKLISTTSAKEDSKRGNDKKTERFKRSKSEKNMRKKDKNEKKRSASAKAKVNLKLIHNRYAKNSKSESPQETIGEDDREVPPNSTRSLLNDQSYISLIGTLEREKPLDLNQNANAVCDILKANETDSPQNRDCLYTESAQVDTVVQQVENLTLKKTLPDESQMCSDSEKTVEIRRKRLFKKPPKHKKKFDDTTKDLINTLNPVPYGYASPRYKRLTNRSMVPQNVCSGYELPSEYVSPELLQKIGSGKHVKLAYRHSLKSSSPVGSRVIVREDSSNSEIVEKAVDICQ